MKGKINVMLVDHLAVVRAGCRLLLLQSDRIRVVCEAEHGDEACKRYAEYRPQVVIMDLDGLDAGGISALRRLAARSPAPAILIFSLQDQLDCITRALEMGAKGYITKRCAPEILVAAVNRLAAGETYLEPSIAERLAAPCNPSTMGEAALNTLSLREFDVFCLLARGYTTRKVAEELCLRQKTVANYATLIKSKLSVSTTAEMARLAYQSGMLNTQSQL